MDADEDTLDRARRGDTAAFRQLVRRHHERLYRTLYGLLRDASLTEEVEQAVWVKVWQKLPAFRGEAAFTTWLHRIAIRAAWDAVRRKRRRDPEVPLVTEADRRADPDRTPNEPDDPGSRPDRVADRSEFRRAFAAALDTLSAKHRLPLVLRDVEGLSYQAIAQKLGIRPGTVMSRLFHARRQLQRQLKDYR
ncbi:MAG: RNA polymerase sigma factor [Opitutales bacterium]